MRTIRLFVAVTCLTLMLAITGCGGPSAQSKPPEPLPVFDPAEAEMRTAVDELGRKLSDTVACPVPRTKMGWALHWDAITAPGYGSAYACVWAQAGTRCYPDPNPNSANHYLRQDPVLQTAFDRWTSPARPATRANAFAHFQAFEQALIELDRVVHPRPETNVEVARKIVTVVAAYEAMRTTLYGAVPVQPSSEWFTAPGNPAAPARAPVAAPAPSAAPECGPVVAAAPTSARAVPQEFGDPFAALPLAGHP